MVFLRIRFETNQSFWLISSTCFLCPNSFIKISYIKFFSWNICILTVDAPPGNGTHITGFWGVKSVLWQASIIDCVGLFQFFVQFEQHQIISRNIVFFFGGNVNFRVNLYYFQAKIAQNRERNNLFQGRNLKYFVCLNLDATVKNADFDENFN